MSDKKKKDGPVSWWHEVDGSGNITAVSSTGQRVSYDDYEREREMQTMITNNASDSITFGSTESGTVNLAAGESANFQTWDGTSWENIYVGDNTLSLSGDSITIGGLNGAEAPLIVNGVDLMAELEKIQEALECHEKRLDKLDRAGYAGFNYEPTKVEFTKWR